MLGWNVPMCGGGGRMPVPHLSLLEDVLGGWGDRRCSTGRSKSRDFHCNKWLTSSKASCRWHCLTLLSLCSTHGKTGTKFWFPVCYLFQCFAQHDGKNTKSAVPYTCLLGCRVGSDVVGIDGHSCWEVIPASQSCATEISASWICGFQVMANLTLKWRRGKDKKTGVDFGVLSARPAQLPDDASQLAAVSAVSSFHGNTFNMLQLKSFAVLVLLSVGCCFWCLLVRTHTVALRMCWCARTPLPRSLLVMLGQSSAREPTAREGFILCFSPISTHLGTSPWQLLQDLTYFPSSRSCSGGLVWVPAGLSSSCPSLLERVALSLSCKGKEVTPWYSCLVSLLKSHRADLTMKLFLPPLPDLGLGNGTQLLWVESRFIASEWAISCGLFSMVTPQIFLSSRRQVTGSKCVVLQADLWSADSHQCCNSVSPQTLTSWTGAKTAQDDPRERKGALLGFELGGNKNISHDLGVFNPTYSHAFCFLQSEDGLC